MKMFDLQEEKINDNTDLPLENFIYCMGKINFISQKENEENPKNEPHNYFQKKLEFFYRIDYNQKNVVTSHFSFRV